MSPTSTLRLTGEMIAVATGGDLVRGSGLSADEGACIDSRIARPGHVIFAIRGPRFDVHDFLPEALARGVSGVVVRPDRAVEVMSLLASMGREVFVVLVEDPEIALVKTAAAWCSMLSPQVVAVTGSVGKTTVKDLVRAVVATRYETHATAGNQNNRLGVSLTCLGLLPRHRLLVTEMGMSARGEITELCRIAPPSVGVVTCVAPVHLETLGSLEEVARAKAELVEALPPEGWAILNADDPRVRAMESQSRARVISFGTEPDARVRLTDVNLDSGGSPTVRLQVDGTEVQAHLGLLGRHQGLNAAAAVAAGLALGISPEEAAAALERVRPARHRMQRLVIGTLRLLDDCYNASPMSMEAALQTLRGIATGRAVAVLGDMRELGEVAAFEHREVGRKAAELGVQVLITVGDFRGAVREGALAGGMSPSQVIEAKDAIEAASVAVAVVQPRDTVLVKASRALGLERVVEALERRFQTETGTEGE